MGLQTPRELGKDEFHEIERKMLSDKGAKKILSGLKDECGMALVVAAESDSWMWPVLAILAGIGALSLVPWLWSFFIKKIQKEIVTSGKATFQEFNNSEPEVSSELRKRANPVRMLPTGNVYHTHEKCPHYKGGRQVHKCLKCSGYEGSM